jgi:hypothetical protein
MQKSRLVELINALSLSDLAELEKCACSPIFNQREHITLLCIYLCDCCRKKEIPTKIAAWQAMLPQEKYNDDRMRNCMSLLSGIIEEFLLLQEQRQATFAPALRLAQQFRKLGLPRHFDSLMSQIRLKHDQSMLRDADFFQQEFEWQQETYIYLSGQNRAVTLNLQSVSDNLDLAYLAQKLRQVCFALSHQSVFKTDYSFGLLPALLQELSQGKYEHIPVISIYYRCYLALTDATQEVHFQEFMSLLSKNKNLFSESEFRDLYLLGINYCIRRMNLGERQYAKSALVLFQDSLQGDWLLRDGKMSRFTYRNAVTMALVEKEFDWAEVFVLRYKPHLEDVYQESAFAYNLARLYYVRGRLDEAQKLLLDADYQDILSNLTAKVLLLKIYYDTQQEEPLLSLSDAMKTLILRHKEISYQAENFKKMLSFLKKIVFLPIGNAKKRVELAEKIRSARVVAERDWLLERLSSKG